MSKNIEHNMFLFKFRLISYSDYSIMLEAGNEIGERTLNGASTPSKDLISFVCAHRRGVVISTLGRQQQKDIIHRSEGDEASASPSQEVLKESLRIYETHSVAAKTRTTLKTKKKDKHESGSGELLLVQKQILRNLNNTGFPIRESATEDHERRIRGAEEVEEEPRGEEAKESDEREKICEERESRDDCYYREVVDAKVGVVFTDALETSETVRLGEGREIGEL
ncbi:hypothetical protein LguiB_009479 [Lonicera macranthoides]